MSLETQKEVLNLGGEVPKSVRRRKRIVFLTSRFEMLGGSEKNICDLTINLRRDIFQPYVLALKGGAVLDDIRARGVHAEEIGITSVVSIGSLVKALKLMRFLREQEIDIVVTYHEDADIWGGIAAYLAGVPVIISSRRDMGYQTSWKHHMAYKVVNRCFSRIVAVSEAVKRKVVQEQIVPATRIRVIHNGAFISRNEPFRATNYLHELLNVPRHHKIVGMVASFRPVKGQEYFVRAAQKILNCHREVEFVIVGNKDTEYYEKISTLVKDLGISANIHCIGHRNDVEAILSCLDIFVLSSVHEGFSNALVEAMAASIPVIVPDSGGNSEIVTKESGVLFKAGDVDGLAEAILRLLRNDAVRRKLGNRARETVAKEFSLAQMISRYEQLFLSELEACTRRC